MDDENNWEIPYDDDDSDNPFCEPLASDDDQYGLYKCKQIKCVYQRMLETPDTDHDFQFDVDWESDSNPQKMLIAKGRSSVTISKSTDSTLFPMAGNPMADIDIKVYKSAISLSVSAGVLALSAVFQ